MHWEYLSNSKIYHKNKIVPATTYWKFISFSAGAGLPHPSKILSFALVTLHPNFISAGQQALRQNQCFFFAPEGRYVYRMPIYPIFALQRSAIYK